MCNPQAPVMQRPRPDWVAIRGRQLLERERLFLLFREQRREQVRRRVFSRRFLVRQERRAIDRRNRQELVACDWSQDGTFYSVENLVIIYNAFDGTGVGLMNLLTLSGPDSPN